MIYTVLKFKMYIGEVLPQVDIEKNRESMLKKLELKKWRGLATSRH
jgi:hypothetical protein